MVIKSFLLLSRNSTCSIDNKYKPHLQNDFETNPILGKFKKLLVIQNKFLVIIAV